MPSRFDDSVIRHPSFVIQISLLLLLLATPSLAAAPAPADKSDDVLYEDADARSSATITQVPPNSATSQMTLENVRRIRVKQNILIIEWGNTATTLLPRQYVSAVAINKRNPPAASPATEPAPH